MSEAGFPGGLSITRLLAGPSLVAVAGRRHPVPPPTPSGVDISGESFWRGPRTLKAVVRK